MSAHEVANAARTAAVQFIDALNEASMKGVRCDFEIEMNPIAGTFALKRFTAFQAMKLEN